MEGGGPGPDRKALTTQAGTTPPPPPPVLGAVGRREAPPI